MVLGPANLETHSGSLNGLVTEALASLLTEHAKGLDTSIYADAVTLETINICVPGGLVGLLHSGDRAPQARSIKSLEEQGNSHREDRRYLPEGSHALFMVGTVSWPQTVWPAIAAVLAKNAFSSCTLCVATPEETWGSIAAAYPPSADSIAQPLTRSNVMLALEKLLCCGQEQAGDRVPTFITSESVFVKCVPLLATAAMSDGAFVLPDAYDIRPAYEHSSVQPNGDGWGSFLAKERPARHGGGEAADADLRQQIERLSLNLVTLMSGLGVHGQFYSLGDTACRVARRCTGITRNIRSRGSPVGSYEQATVVLVDRTADLVAPLHHNQHLLDQLYRALPPNALASGNSSDRIVTSSSKQDDLASAESLGGSSLLSLIRQCELNDNSSTGAQSKIDMWDTLLMQSRPVALQLLRKALADELAAISNNPEEAATTAHGRVTSEQLQAMIDAYRAQPASPSYNGALADIAQAIVTSEKTGSDDHWKEIEGAEKTLKLVIGGIKDSLPETAQATGSPDAGFSSSALEEEMCAAWDQVLTAIPPLASSMLSRFPTTEAATLADADAERYVSQYLWQHTPAPGMVLMAASLLAPSKGGIPAEQRLLIEQRLSSDCSAVLNLLSWTHLDMAGRWAKQVTNYANLVAASEGQRSRLKHWRELAGMSLGSSEAYSSLLERVASSVLSGSSECADLEHAEQGSVVAAANLLKGLGRRFLAGDGTGTADVSRQGAGEAAKASRVVVVFAVGGITFDEVARVAAAGRQLGGMRAVLVGGTTISSAANCALLHE
ncbi:hypothetical protein EV183_001881 [Coemansia sp. RSA 2336]|nr:hypothetical protein EV183_001881 [Coemansia sp. RSA 2336]